MASSSLRSTYGIDDRDYLQILRLESTSLATCTPTDPAASKELARNAAMNKRLEVLMVVALLLDFLVV
jgi:hypothetical protein